MSTIVAASPMPLFDRIAGFAEASFDGRLMDGSGLRQSLLRDLSRLLNVRNGLPVDEFLASDGSVLHYGLPDVLALSPGSEEHLHTLANCVAHAIRLYEPRLSHVEVKASGDRSKAGSVRISLAAAVSIGLQLCRVDFDVLLDSRSLAFEGAQ
jgi:type VI secretion system protein ImpF